jgi:hypothetical protein
VFNFGDAARVHCFSETRCIENLQVAIELASGLAFLLPKRVTSHLYEFVGRYIVILV